MNLRLEYRSLRGGCFMVLSKLINHVGVSRFDVPRFSGTGVAFLVYLKLIYYAHVAS